LLLEPAEPVDPPLPVEPPLLLAPPEPPLPPLCGVQRPQLTSQYVLNHSFPHSLVSDAHLRQLASGQFGSGGGSTSTHAAPPLPVPPLIEPPLLEPPLVELDPAALLTVPPLGEPSFEPTLDEPLLPVNAPPLDDAPALVAPPLAFTLLPPLLLALLPPELTLDPLPEPATSEGCSWGLQPATAIKPKNDVTDANATECCVSRKE
jgi:hypothetical protein